MLAVFLKPLRWFGGCKTVLEMVEFQACPVLGLPKYPLEKHMQNRRRPTCEA